MDNHRPINYTKMSKYRDVLRHKRNKVNVMFFIGLLSLVFVPIAFYYYITTTQVIKIEIPAKPQNMEDNISINEKTITVYIISDTTFLYAVSNKLVEEV